MSKVLVLCMLILASYAVGPCRKFICKDPVDPQDPEVCASITKKSPTDWVEYVGRCEEKKTCRMNEVDDATMRCVDNPEFTKYPGQKCSKEELCLTKKLVDGYCRGVAQGQACESHLYCDVGLMCGLDLQCVPAVEEGEYCDEGHLKCQSYLNCMENRCRRYGTIENGHSPGRQGADMCQTRFVNSHGVCDEAPLLKGEIFVESNEVKCVYSNGEENKAVCGYHVDGKAICKPGMATLQPLWQDLLAYLASKPLCSLALSDMGQCDFARNNMGEKAYLKGRIAYALLHTYTQLQMVPTCVQVFVHPEYYEMVKALGSGSYLSAFSALLIALLFALL